MAETEILPMTTDHCTVERDGNVVILTMNRPEARNALSPDMLVGLADGYHVRRRQRTTSAARSSPAPAATSRRAPTSRRWASRR